MSSGGKAGTFGVASASSEAVDRKERLRKLALETFDLSKDPYVFRNRVGSCSAAWWSGAAPRSRSLGRAAPPRPPRRAFPRLSAPVPAPAHAQARSSANSA